MVRRAHHSRNRLARCRATHPQIEPPRPYLGRHPRPQRGGDDRGIVHGIRADLVDAVALVDELVVIDSDSTDATARVARSDGAQVWAAAEIRPELGAYRGKGEALWKSQFVTTGDVLVFIDADLTGWGTHFVTGLRRAVAGRASSPAGQGLSTTGVAATTATRPKRGRRAAG